MNRYFKEIITQSSGGVMLFETEEDEGEETKQDLPALVAITGAHSGIDPHCVVFPHLTRWNSVRLYMFLRANPHEFTPETLLSNMLGKRMFAKLTEQYGNFSSFRCDSTYSSVTVGVHCYHTYTDRKERVASEHMSSRSRYCVRSWFAIVDKNVPNHQPERLDDHFEEDIYVYGRFKRFIRLEVNGWNMIFHLAECELYRVVDREDITNHFIINLEENKLEQQYVPLNRIVGPAILAPQLDWNQPVRRANETPIPEKTGNLIVLSVLDTK